MTVRTLIRDALQEIGALAAGEPLSSADAAAGLTRVMSFMDAAQTERLAIFHLDKVTLPLVVGQQEYFIGDRPTADLVYPIRPQTIQLITLWVGGATPYEQPVRLVTIGEWAAIAMKGITDTHPTTAYYLPSFPLGSLSVWPIPTTAANWLLLRIPRPLDAGVTLDTDLVLAPGYEEYLRYNLAVRLYAPFGRPADPVIVGLASEATSRIKHANTRPAVLGMDPAVLPSGGGWNWMTGGL